MSRGFGFVLLTFLLVAASSFAGPQQDQIRRQFAVDDYSVGSAGDAARALDDYLAKGRYGYTLESRDNGLVRTEHYVDPSGYFTLLGKGLALAAGPADIVNLLARQIPANDGHGESLRSYTFQFDTSSPMADGNAGLLQLPIQSSDRSAVGAYRARRLALLRDNLARFSGLKPSAQQARRYLEMFLEESGSRQLADAKPYLDAFLAAKPGAAEVNHLIFGSSLSKPVYQYLQRAAVANGVAPRDVVARTQFGRFRSAVCRLGLGLFSGG